MKQIKRLLAAILVVLMLTAFIPTIASAAGNSIADATSISFGNYYTGSLTETNTNDVYKFTISSSGRIKIDLTAYIEKTNYFIYDVKGNKIWEAWGQYWNDVSKEYNMDETVDLTSGTYYFAIEKNYSTGNYKFKLSFVSANESFKEPNGGDNNSIATADTISTGTQYLGQIAENDDCDIYKFSLSSSGRININLTAYIYRSSYYIYDVKGNEVWYRDWQYWSDVSKEFNLNENVDLTSGSYYFAIKTNSGTGNYKFKLSYSSANESFAEPSGGDNNSIATADVISLGTKYKGQIAANDDCDIYKFTVPSSGKITLVLTAYIYRTNYYIYDTKGNEIWYKDWQYWNETSKELNLNEKIDLSSGTYYFAIMRNSGTGNYNFAIYAGNYTPKNGLIKESGKWMYYVNGKIDYNFVGLVKNQYGWWYVQNGTINFKYTGMAKNAYGWWYVKNGKLDRTYNGMAKNKYGWWYLKNGTIDYKFKGLAKNQYGWWYIENGTINYKYKGLVKNEYGWWYVQNGTINFKYNGYASNQYGRWKVVNGKVVSKA